MAHPRADARLQELSCVAFDVETTGLSAATERIVELSAVRFSLEGEQGSFDELVDPGRPIPPEAARVHGITDAQLKDKPTAGAVIERFVRFADGAVLMAHNAEFDVGFLTHEAARHGLPLPYLPVLDTVEIARRLRPDLPNHKLATVARALGCSEGTYHRALADAATVARCFHQLLARHYAPAARLQALTLRELLGETGPALAFGPAGRLRMWVADELLSLDDALQHGGDVTVVYRPPDKAEQVVQIKPRGYLRRPEATFLMAARAAGGADLSLRLDWITRSHRAQQSLF